MKHAKRMALVPEEMLDRFEQKQKLETSPITSDLLRSDIRLSDILEHSGLDDDEKQNLYNASMERYLELRLQKDSQVPTVRFAPNKEEEKQPEPQLSEDVVVEHIPKTMRPRATALLNRLKSRPDVISWDKTGQVKIEGETIQDSNISDLVCDAMRSRNNFNPTCSKEFFQALSKLNVPKDLVRNQERWKRVNDTPVAREFSSPRFAGSAERFRTALKSYEERDAPKQWVDY